MAAARSIAHYNEDGEANLEGTQLMSIETESDSQEWGIYEYIQDHFSEFLRYVRMLSRKDQEMLLSYYLVRKTQTQLAKIFHATQTVCSFRIRLTVRALLAMILFGGPNPTVDQIRPILESASLERTEMQSTELRDYYYSDENGDPKNDENKIKDGNLTVVSLADVIVHFIGSKSFTATADSFGVHRPDARRYMSRAAKALFDAKDPDQQALGAWLSLLINRKNPKGAGLSNRELAKQGDLYLQDPAILGQFRINVQDPDFNAMFQSGSNFS